MAARRKGSAQEVRDNQTDAKARSLVLVFVKYAAGKGRDGFPRYFDRAAIRLSPAFKRIAAAAKGARALVAAAAAGIALADRSGERAISASVLLNILLKQRLELSRPALLQVIEAGAENSPYLRPSVLVNFLEWWAGAFGADRGVEKALRRLFGALDSSYDAAPKRKLEKLLAD